MSRSLGSLSRLLAGVSLCAALLFGASSADASRSPSAEESAAIYAAVGYTSVAKCSSLYVSTVDQNWAYLEEAYIVDPTCPPRPGGKIAWFVQKVNGTWSVTAAATVYGVPEARLCAVFTVSQNIPPANVYRDAHPCGSTPPPNEAPAPAATPAPTPTPAPVKAPTATPLPQIPTGPSVGGGSSSGRTSQNTTILCAPSGSSSRTARRKPITCNTLGPDDSFSGAFNLAKLKWRGWGKSVATATGVDRGFSSPASKIRVTVTASRPRENDCDGFTYTRLTVHSKYGTTRQTLPAACED